MSRLVLRPPIESWGELFLSTDMKYSILGFYQPAVLAIAKDVIVEQKSGEYPKTKTLKLDCIDLLILRDVADFMNRKKIIKYTVDDKIYFSIQYSAIIEDLPILGIKQQALSDRLSKLVELEMLEKVVIKNQAGSFIAFRLGEKYESIKYTPTESEIGTSSELHLQKYQTTFAEVADYEPKYSSTNNSSTNKEERIDKSIPKKKAKFNVRDDLSYVDKTFLNLWRDWLSYKDELGCQYKTQRGAMTQYKSLMKYSNKNIILATAIVNRSIENSWQGLFDIEEVQKQKILADTKIKIANGDDDIPDGTINEKGQVWSTQLKKWLI